MRIWKIVTDHSKLFVCGCIVCLLLVCSAFGIRSFLFVPKYNQTPMYQCAHWCVFRSCQLLGVPLNLDTIASTLPVQNKGHSMFQVVKTLQKIGFEAEGRHETIESLSQKQCFPCIAHMTTPDHFVVISDIDDNYIHVFDGGGVCNTPISAEKRG